MLKEGSHIGRQCGFIQPFNALDNQIPPLPGIDSVCALCLIECVLQLEEIGANGRTESEIPNQVIPVSSLGVAPCQECVQFARHQGWKVVHGQGQDRLALESIGVPHLS